MITKTKLTLAAALVFGLASAAVAEDAAVDSIRNYGPVARAAQLLIEGRNAFVQPSPTAEKIWFKRASHVPTS